MFIEVDSIEKGCPVIINLEHIIEIAPLRDGGCSIFYADSAAVNGKTAMKVKNSYDHFKQFAMTTVSSEDVQKRIDSMKKFYKAEDEQQEQTTQEPVKTKKQLMKEIPKL